MRAHVGISNGCANYESCMRVGSLSVTIVKVEFYSMIIFTQASINFYMDLSELLLFVVRTALRKKYGEFQIVLVPNSSN